MDANDGPKAKGKRPHPVLSSDDDADTETGVPKKQKTVIQNLRDPKTNTAKYRSPSYTKVQDKRKKSMEARTRKRGEDDDTESTATKPAAALEMVPTSGNVVKGHRSNPIPAVQKLNGFAPAKPIIDLTSSPPVSPPKAASRPTQRTFNDCNSRSYISLPLRRGHSRFDTLMPLVSKFPTASSYVCSLCSFINRRLVLSTKQALKPSIESTIPITRNNEVRPPRPYTPPILTDERSPNVPLVFVGGEDS